MWELGLTWPNLNENIGKGMSLSSTWVDQTQHQSGLATGRMLSQHDNVILVKLNRADFILKAASTRLHYTLKRSWGIIEIEGKYNELK